MYEVGARMLAGSQDNLVEMYKKMISDLALEHINRPIHDNHDVATFLESLPDDKLLILADPYKFFLKGG